MKIYITSTDNVTPVHIRITDGYYASSLAGLWSVGRYTSHKGAAQIWDQWGTMADVDMIMKAYVGSDSCTCFLGARLQADTDFYFQASSPSSYFGNGYTAVLTGYSGTGTDTGIKEGSTWLAGSSGVSTGVTYWVRFNLVGTTLRMRYWAVGDPEPTTWAYEVTSSTYASGPKCGVAVHTTASSTDLDAQATISAVGFDTSGVSAPTGGGLASISGTVTLNGAPLQGATVIAVRHDYDASKPAVVGLDYVSTTTDANGNYILTINCTGTWFHVMAFYDDGINKYTDVTKVFVEV